MSSLTDVLTVQQLSRQLLLHSQLRIIDKVGHDQKSGTYKHTNTKLPILAACKMTMTKLKQDDIQLSDDFGQGDSESSELAASSDRVKDPWWEIWEAWMSKYSKVTTDPAYSAHSALVVSGGVGRLYCSIHHVRHHAGSDHPSCG